jgi:hypothetical protein
MVVLVAHTGKDASRGLRGWSGVKGALDVEITVDKCGQHHAATVTKMKDGVGEGDEHGFELQSVIVGQDEDGEDISSCVVKPTTLAPKAQRKAEPRGAVQQVVMRTAAALTDLSNTVTTQELIDAAVNEMPRDDGKRDKRREHVMRAIHALTGAGLLSATAGLVNVL